MSDAVIPRIALGLPARGQVHCQTQHSLINMVGRFTQLFVASGQAELAVITVDGTLLPQMRNTIVEQAIARDCTHVLWVDSDMMFPAHSLERLLQHNEPVVGCNYAQRKRPSKPTAARSDGNGGRIWVYGDEGLGEKVPAEFLGHGLCLVETSVYEAMPAPWYMLGWSVAKQNIIGEDVFFFQKMKRIGGVVPYIDTVLSAEVRHIGDHDYSLADAIADRPAVIAEIEKEAASGS